MTFVSSSDLIDNFRYYLSNQDNFIIFSPYIKESALIKLLDGFEFHCAAIVTSWNPVDIALGATDISIYTFCRKYGIQLLINNKIHLKSIVSGDFNSCIITSSNITNRGLALIDSYNYELGNIQETLCTKTKCYFDRILDESILVSDDYFEDIKNQACKLPSKIEKIPLAFENFQYNAIPNFLIFQLPYFERPFELFEVYSNMEQYSEEEVRSVMHDLRLYQIEEVTSQKQIYSDLRKGFKDHFFIKEFLRFNAEGKYFGELTSWLHEKIENVPSPKRYEVKEFLHIIFNYIDYLLDDEYLITIPGRHSQMLQRLNKHES